MRFWVNRYANKQSKLINLRKKSTLGRGWEYVRGFNGEIGVDADGIENQNEDESKRKTRQ